MGDSYAGNQTLNQYEVPCPYRDGFKGQSATLCGATAEVLDHLADVHWSELPDDAKDAIHACAHAVAGIPV